MKIIEPKVEFMTPIDGDSILKHLEQCGRVCYKSEGKIEDGSAEKFIANIIKRGHEAVLEHGTFILEVDEGFYTETQQRINEFEETFGFKSFLRFTNDTRPIISGNVRAWRDFFKVVKRNSILFPHSCEDLIRGNPILFPEFQNEVFNKSHSDSRVISVSDLQTENEKLTHWDKTVKFICDRGVSHEIVRHRMASYCQESTRYCNYSKDDFNNEITVIKPCFLKEGTQGYRFWEAACILVETAYFDLLEWGCTPQEARAVLPNSLKTEVVMTNNIRGWWHFFRLRDSSAAHPQMREVANMLLAKCKESIPVLFDDIG